MTFLGRGGGGYVTLLNIHCSSNIQYLIIITTTTLTTKKISLLDSLLLLQKKIVFWTVFDFLPSQTPTRHPKISNSLVYSRVGHHCGTPCPNAKIYFVTHALF